MSHIKSTDCNFSIIFAFTFAKKALCVVLEPFLRQLMSRKHLRSKLNGKKVDLLNVHIGSHRGKESSEHFSYFCPRRTSAAWRGPHNDVTDFYGEELVLTRI